MILGILTAVVFALVAASFFTRNLPESSRFKHVFRTIHKPLGYALIVLIAVHFAITLKLFYQRPIAVYLLGFSMFACTIFASLTRTLFRKNPKRGLLLHKLCGLAMVLLLAAHATLCIVSFQAYQRDVAAISISNISAVNTPDGVYAGECDVGYIQARVRVTIADGSITDIALVEHRNERGAAGEGVIDEILSTQALPVDAISGATNSSRVIQKAVENALSAAPAN